MSDSGRVSHIPVSPFMGFEAEGTPRAQIVGFPYEATSSFRFGSRSGPDAIRHYAESLETYSPYCRRDLADMVIADLGNVDLEEGRLFPDHLDALRRHCATLKERAFTLFLAGEHTSTLAFISPEEVEMPGFLLLVMDAHLDLRDEYEGERYSHATWLRRALEWLGPDRILVLGARAGTPEEFRLARQHGLLLRSPRDILEALEDRRPRRIHVSLDIDVLDPSIAPGTGNPEPMGWRVEDVLEVLERLQPWNVVSADVVEYSPPHDPSGVTGVVAAFLVREMLLNLGRNAV